MLFIWILLFFRPGFCVCFAALQGGRGSYSDFGDGLGMKGLGVRTWPALISRGSWLTLVWVNSLVFTLAGPGPSETFEKTVVLYGQCFSSPTKTEEDSVMPDLSQTWLSSFTRLLSHNVGWFLFSHSLSLCLRMRQHVLRSVEILPWVQWLSCWGNWGRALNSAVLWVLWLVWKSVASSRNLCLGLVISLWRLLEFRDAEPQWRSVTLNSGLFSGCWECKFHLCAGKRGPMASVHCSFTCMAVCAPPPWGTLRQGILSLSGVGWGSGAVSRGNHSTRLRLTL